MTNPPATVAGHFGTFDVLAFRGNATWELIIDHDTFFVSCSTFCELCISASKTKDSRAIFLSCFGDNADLYVEFPSPQWMGWENVWKSKFVRLIDLHMSLFIPHSLVWKNMAVVGWMEHWSSCDQLSWIDRVCAQDQLWELSERTSNASSIAWFTRCWYL